MSFSLSGTGQAATGLLQANPAFLSLGGTSVGGELTGTVTFGNAGAQPLTVADFTPPGAPNTPFSVSGAPEPNHTLQPGGSITVNISFDPQSVGQYSDEITLDTTDGESQTIGLSASAGTPGLLQFSSQAVDFGSVTLGSTASRTFTISNVGGTAVTINKSKPPFGGAFAPATSLPEGTSIAAGQTVSETVTFAPTSPGPASGAWQITGDDGSGPHQVQFTGTGASALLASAPTTGSPAPGSGSAPTPGVTKTPGAPRFTAAVVTTRTLAGTYITYNAMTVGVSRFVLQRVTVGRRAGHRCVAVDPRNRSSAWCTRYVVVATFAHRDRVGANKLRLGTYVALRKLRVGSYRLQSTLMDTAGARHTFRTALRIITPPPRSIRGTTRLGGRPSRACSSDWRRCSSCSGRGFDRPRAGGPSGCRAGARPRRP